MIGYQTGSEKNMAEHLDGDRAPEEMADQEFQVDLPLLLQTLKENLPENDRTPVYLIQALRQITDYHDRLVDWIGLHGHLKEILFNFGSFFREVERLSAAHEDPEPPTIGIYWRPISQRVTHLLDWASSPRKFFDTEPFARLDDRIVGPLWAVQLCAASDRLDELLRSERMTGLFISPRGSRPSRAPYVDINELLDAASEFHDIAERALYLADRQIYETIAELQIFTKTVFSTLEKV